MIPLLQPDRPRKSGGDGSLRLLLSGLREPLGPLDESGEMLRKGLLAELIAVVTAGLFVGVVAVKRLFLHAPADPAIDPARQRSADKETT